MSRFFFLQQTQQNISLKKYDQFLQGAPHKVLDLATSNPSGLQRTPCRVFWDVSGVSGSIGSITKIHWKHIEVFRSTMLFTNYPAIFKHFLHKNNLCFFSWQRKKGDLSRQKTPPYPGVRSVPALSHAKHLWVLHRGVRSRRHPHPLRNTHGAPSTQTKWWKWIIWVEIFINQICSEWFSNFFWAGFPTHPLFWFIKLNKKYIFLNKKTTKKVSFVLAPMEHALSATEFKTATWWQRR